MIMDLNTFLHKAVPDTKLTIKKYLDVKFEYLVCEALLIFLTSARSVLFCTKYLTINLGLNLFSLLNVG